MPDQAVHHRAPRAAEPPGTGAEAGPDAGPAPGPGAGAATGPDRRAEGRGGEPPGAAARPG
ncbi:hypothetical protein ACFWJK_33995, partial [Streptomyces sp. NPDC127103]